MALPFLNSRKFVLLVGDDGAVLAYVSKSRVVKRLFAPSAALKDRRELHNLFTKYPDVPVYIMLDIMEQSYTKQTMPAVSSFAISALVKKRLDRDFAASDIKGAVMLGRDTHGRKDWNYMFAAAPMTTDIGEWIDYVASLENRLVGIYMLPVEMENFVKKLSSKAKTKIKEKAKLQAQKKVEEAAKPQQEMDFADEVEAGNDSNRNDVVEHVSSFWQFITTHNKTGGFRQVVLQDGKVIFTRLIRHMKDNVADIIAGNIEQEMLNTLDYMRRLSFGDDDEIEIVAILSKDLKASLSNTKVRGENIILYTPFEAAKVVGVKEAAGEDDKFADLVIAASFANSSAILRLESQQMVKTKGMLLAHTMLTLSAVMVVPVFLLFSGYMVYSIFGVHKKVAALEDDKASIEKKWKDARKSDEYNIDDANKIIDVMSLHKQLSAGMEPMQLLAKVSVAQKGYALMKSLNWTYEQKLNDDGQSAGASVESAIFNLEFKHAGNNIEELFSSYDSFVNDIKSHVGGGYVVEIEELPETITFGDSRDVLPLQVVMKSVGEDSQDQ